MKSHFKILVLCLALLPGVVSGQMSTEPRYSLLLGLNQPVFLRGINVEANYWMKKFVLDYSHGVGLHLDGDFTGGDMKDQQLDLKVTHSLGIGFGYRITREFNLRIEPKFHFFQVYYNNESQSEANMITDYATFTLGLGAYYRWMPFEREQGWLKGLTIAPSIRFWPNVNSSLKDDKYSYHNKLTGNTEVLHAANIGLGNTPWIFNVSVGYSF